MKLVHIFILVFATSSAFAFNGSQLHNDEIEGRITHSEYATEGQFPYQVGLLKDSIGRVAKFCGGALIDIKWILTAAHCLVDTKGLTVYLGSTVHQQSDYKIYVSQEKFIIHPKFRGTIAHDIALIKIPPVDLSWKVKIIKLPSIWNKASSVSKDSFAIGSGWGKTCDKEVFVPEYLHFSRFQIISNDVCRTTFANFPDSIVCIATLNDGCELNYPAAYVRAADYLEWICYNIATYNNIAKYYF